MAWVEPAAERPDPGPTLRRQVALGLVSVAVLVLVVWGSWARRTHVVLPDGLPWEAVAWPIDVAGVEAHSAAHAQALARRLPEGTTVDLGAEAGRWTTQREGSDLTIWIALVTGLAYWAVAAFMLAPRTRRRGVISLYGAMMATGVAIGISGPAPPRVPAETILGVAYMAALCLVPAFFVHFSTLFPRTLELPGGRARSPWALTFLATGIALWRSARWVAWTSRPSESGFEAMRTPEMLTYALLALGILAGLVALGANARRTELERERRQAMWILWGIAIGATPYVFLIGLPRLLGTEGLPLSDAAESLGELMVPAAITIAVVRDRFLDIDVIIRRSLIYTLLALGAAGLAALVILLAGAGLGWSEPVVAALAVGLPALLFFPARRVVSRWVDRTFFRIRHGHERSLDAFRAELTEAGSRDAVGAHTRAFLDRTLEPKRVAVAVRRGEHWSVHGDADPALAEAASSWLTSVRGASDGVAAALHATALPEVEHAGFPEQLTGVGLRLAQPVPGEDPPRAVLLVGERRAERRYVEEDLRLIAASALQMGRALERVDLIQRATEEAMKRRHIAELVRQKADFFARVAHDLRTPLTAIRWSVRNLSEELVGPLNERQSEYLDSVGAAAGQLGRLVDNLVDLSRLDLDAVQPPPEPVDVISVTAEAISALRPIADERGARIELSAPGRLPHVRGRTEAAFQIVINLLDNALKYTPTGTAVDVELTATHEDEVQITIRDRGPGLPAEGREQLFELFTRGPESPHVNSKGFGIGLHIVKAWTDSLGGTVSADNHPEGGARFVCRLPVWHSEEPRA